MGAANAAYVIGHVSVKNPQKWADYQARVPATLAPWGAELVFRGQQRIVLRGDCPYTDAVVLRFPDLAALPHWHESAAYQALIDLRNEAIDLVLVGFES